VHDPRLLFGLFGLQSLFLLLFCLLLPWLMELFSCLFAALS
jgi:hypothetical protein